MTHVHQLLNDSHGRQNKANLSDYLFNLMSNWCRLTLLTGILLANPALAQTDVFTIGVQNQQHYLPYSAIEDGKYVGFNRELLDSFAEYAGYRFEYRPYPIKRLYLSLLTGQVDLKYPDNPYWSSGAKQGRNISYSSSVVEYIDGVMVRPDNLHKQLTEIKRLGILAGFTPLPYRSLVESGGLHIEEIFGYEKLLQQTLVGSLDGAYSNIKVSRYYLEQVLSKPDSLVFNSNLPSIKSQRHLSSIQHPGIITRFNEFLRDQKQAVDMIKRRHGLD